MKITDAGCEPAALKLPAGPTTFQVRERRRHEGHRVRGARRRPHPRRGREHRPGPQRRVLAHARARHLHDLLPRRHDRGAGHADGDRRRLRRPSADATAAVRDYRRFVEGQTAQLVDAHRGVRRGGQGRRHRRRPRRSTAPRAHRTSGSSRSPRASATSTRRSTPARATSRQAELDRLPPPRAGALGHAAASRAPAPLADKLAPRRDGGSQTRVTDGRARGGADRQRRRRAARRGLQVEDHRRGGALLAHRPARLRGERRRRTGRVRRGPADRRRQRPGARDDDRRAVRRRHDGPLRAIAAATASSPTPS